MITSSPPHAWGILLHAPRQVAQHRFTPTRVANTARRIRDAAPRAVHPHTRGEYGSFNRRIHSAAGSPPHAWGIRRGLAKRRSSGRFTPTCVGNTPPCKSKRPSRPVHPHTRGEYKRSGVAVHGWGGHKVKETLKREISPRLAWRPRSAIVEPKADSPSVLDHANNNTVICLESRREALNIALSGRPPLTQPESP